MKKKWLISISVLFLLLISAFFLFYPKLKNKESLNKQEDLLAAIESGVGEISMDLPEDETELDYYGDVDTSPATSTMADEEISSVNGIGIIEIKSINLHLPIVEGVEGSKLKIAPGHVSETAGIGETGNCIIAGHRNYRYGEMFNRLDEVKVGDKIIITLVEGTIYTYQVHGVTVIEPGDMKLFDYVDGQKKLTLLTCTPIRKATHRLLVLANLVE